MRLRLKPRQIVARGGHSLRWLWFDPLALESCAFFPISWHGQGLLPLKVHAFLDFAALRVRAHLAASKPTRLSEK